MHMKVLDKIENQLSGKNPNHADKQVLSSTKVFQDILLSFSDNRDAAYILWKTQNPWLYGMGLLTGKCAGS